MKNNGTHQLIKTKVYFIDTGKENIHMMMNKRLIAMVGESKKYIAGNVIFQWLGMLANILMMYSITGFLGTLLPDSGRGGDFYQNIKRLVLVVVFCILARFLCTLLSNRMSFLSAKTVKKTLRQKIYEKLLTLGSSYQKYVASSEVVQIAVEGVDQLETYFGAYLPQFFYAMLAPLTLFIVLCFVNVPAAILLLVCVPMIPMAIVFVQKWAKKLLSKYWGQYTALGDTFLEDLQGLTTLKIYQADGYKSEKMDEEAEKFRKITMKVLTMQLNSITIMDIVAYGGAALGMIVAILQYRTGHIDLTSTLFIILLSADFFIPMRQLGSFFHVAMNGMAASDKIFALLDVKKEETGEIAEEVPQTNDLCMQDLSFSYDESRQILVHINLLVKSGQFVALVGASGCGKSTIASLFMGRNTADQGQIPLGGLPLAAIPEDVRMQKITYVSHDAYLFKGSVRDNLLMAKEDATEGEMWKVLEQTKLSDFLRQEEGLDTKLLEKASNLSGGQRQRLALARALLHDSPIYIFDEATSNIDVESENDIMEQIIALAKTKTVLLISHRLANVVGADQIYVLEKGQIVEVGQHESLLQEQKTYASLWQAQQELENYGKSEKGGAQA